MINQYDKLAIQNRELQKELLIMDKIIYLILNDLYDDDKIKVLYDYYRNKVENASI